MLTFCMIWALVALCQAAPLDEVSSTSEFVCLQHACYSISWEKKRFTKAKTVCEARNGQLLTVKNSVQADAISLFMSKVEKDVKVWIGLEQPFINRCTDVFQPLRGFSWVSGGSDTDYANWRNPGFHKCGALCVTAHRDGTWEETDCDIKADGYLCELNYQGSCRPLNLQTDVNITYTHMSMGLGRSGGPVFPPGTNAYISTFQDALLCTKEGDGQVQWKGLKPGPWDCSIENGGCEDKCEMEAGIPKCTCPESELKDDNRTCVKPCDPNPCSQLCSPMEESPGFMCMCQEGYELVDDGKTCIDIDDCALNSDICEHHCTNTIGSFVCGCKPGFELVTDSDCDKPEGCTECLDIDECLSPINLCEQECDNFPGGYRCVCYDGYVVDEKHSNKCKMFCNTSSCVANCDINIMDKCECPDGYIVDQDDEDNILCTDVDECETNSCDYNCTNTFGSYVCTCPEGFILDGSDCKYDEEGSGVTETTTLAKRPFETTPTKRPSPDIHSLQPAMLLGICIGVISILAVLIAILCHMLRKHYMEQHALEYKTTNAEKDVSLQQVKTDPQRKY